MSQELLTSLLKDVSRSFYLTMRVLPGPIRSQISLAYLLARASDTIADTEILPVVRRREALAEFKGRILGHHQRRLDFGQLAQNQSKPSERVLLERCEEALTLLNAFSQEDQACIQHVLDIIIGGQDLDLVRFSEADAGHIVALKTEEELDDYTYRVAGCVGEFWTHICRRGLFPKANLDDHLLLENGIRFGKGLQLINILRDLPADLRMGRCYLPAQTLAPAGFTPVDLLDAGNGPRFSPLYQTYLARARAHLTAGWAYTNMLPRGQMRVRLACAWPVLIGAGTLDKLACANVLNANERVKINRAEVRSIILRSLWLYPFSKAWQRQYKEYSPAKE